MIEPLSWEWRREDEENPFRKGSTRPIKITIHSSSFHELDAEQASALALLRELAMLGDIDVLDTDRSAAKSVEIGDPEPGQDFYDVTVWNDGERGLGTYIPHPKQQRTTAQTLVLSADPLHPEFQAALQDVVLVGAHNALGRDVLITESRWIHDPRWRHGSRSANPRTILQAAQIVGLLLRSRNNYVFRGARKSLLDPIAFSRSLFYLVLMRHRTPSMWRYYSACVASGDRRASEIPAIGTSILSRCKHAIEARDHIGEAYYAPHSDGSSDHTTYHFDYLTLLLVGALDAQARIAHRAYGLKGTDRVNFRGGTSSGFVQGLRKAGAMPLYDLLIEPRTEALLTLLFEIRNTIHSASLASHGYHTTGKGPGWIEVNEGELATKLWNAASAAGGAEAWGLKKVRYQLGDKGPVVEPIQLAPYPYAVQLVRDGLGLVDRIAAATDVDRLFDSRERPDLLERPPEDQIYSTDVMTRLGLLG